MAAAAQSSTLFSQLRDACLGDWQAYTHHAFLNALADGSLPEVAFRHYLVQDYLFLIHFARAYGLAAFKAETLADLRAATDGLRAIVDREMQLHVDFCAGWGLTADDMAGAEEAEATLAYTRYVLERGLAGDLLDLQVALAPCVIGYAEIGRRLADDPKTAMVGNPYRTWIESYAGADYQAVADAHQAQMDALMARRGGRGRLPGLIRIFREATRLEAAFWAMGLSPPNGR
jgi:thiaminase/transcriptional activator TenA